MRRFLLIFLSLSVFDWIMGVLRFSYPLYKYVFIAVNFPSSLVYLALESKSSTWWFTLLGTGAVNDETAQMILFGLMVAVQAVIYTLILKKITSLKVRSGSPD